jgi:hypothetical protein
VPDFVAAVVSWFAHLSPFKKGLLGFATTVFVVELILRRFARETKVYAGWTRFFMAIGKVWTAVILSIVYVGSVGVIGIVMRLLGKDPLDRTLAGEPSFWRNHEPNPLGPVEAVRHQF